MTARDPDEGGSKPPTKTQSDRTINGGSPPSAERTDRRQSADRRRERTIQCYIYKLLPGDNILSEWKEELKFSHRSNADVARIARTVPQLKTFGGAAAVV